MLLCSFYYTTVHNDLHILAIYTLPSQLRRCITNAHAAAPRSENSAADASTGATPARPRCSDDRLRPFRPCASTILLASLIFAPYSGSASRSSQGRPPSSGPTGMLLLPLRPKYPCFICANGEFLATPGRA